MVVLPAPLGPNNANNSPGETVSVRESTATLRANVRVTLSNSIMRLPASPVAAHSPPSSAHLLAELRGFVVSETIELDVRIEEENPLPQDHAVLANPKRAA